MPIDEENQREWRTLILNKLNGQERTLDDIKKDISSININMPSPKTITDMENRIRDLEKFKTSAQTMFFIIQGLIGIGMIVLQHFWK